MTNIKMTIESKEYGSGRLSFSAIQVKLEDQTVLTDKIKGPTFPAVEAALEKVTAETEKSEDAEKIEVSLINVRLQDGEKEYLTDKFNVIFA